MNQLCKVCGEPAAGFHFGAFTCEGCKSFFGRTYNNISSISECKNNGECVINKKNRTACKACRLRKCLLVGMSKSGSRYGRRSNWFKIHCLLQEQQQAGANIAAAAANLLRPHPYLSTLFHNNVQRDSRSSESDSGASSADPDDYLKINHSSDRELLQSTKRTSSDSECFTHKKFVSALVNPPSISPASLPSVSPSSVIPKWLPPFQGFGDPAAWRDLWIRETVPMAAPAPDQNEPIDLSVKPASNRTPPRPPTPESDNELCIDVGVDEPVKSVPLDLTLDRVTTDIQ